MGDYPVPASNEFSAEQERAMRQANRMTPPDDPRGPPIAIGTSARKSPNGPPDAHRYVGIGMGTYDLDAGK